MPAILTVEAHYALQFTRNLELVLQQRTPRFAGTHTEGSYTGDRAQVVLKFGEVEMTPIYKGTNPGQWKGDTVWSEVDHHQRWVNPRDFALSLPIAKQDEIRMLVNPTSPYLEVIRAAYARMRDNLFIGAATGVAKVGPYEDTVDVSFPAGQVIDGTDGLTIDKLIDAKEKLIAAGNDPDEPRFFACSEKQLSDLLKNTKVQSADYNTVRALVKGEVDTFVGFKFISSERLNKTDTKRNCLAWVKTGMHTGTWDTFTIRTDVRTDKNYVVQLYARASVGVTRTDEKKVVQVNCVEA